MIDKVIAHIDANKDAYVERLNELLRIPSVSTDPDHKNDIKRAATWVHKLFADAGINADIIETKRHPAVIADGGPEDGEGLTALVYGHYDVQPTGDESLWDTPAFEPTIRDGAIFARGSADDKGQVLTHLFAAEAWMKATGKLPARVKFLIEGEEEIGSPNLSDLVRDHAKRLACDYVALSDTPKLDENTPAITYGTKGMIYKQIDVSGPKQDLHSGAYGGTLVNPANALAAIIAALHDEDNRVTIPGYYDEVRELSEQEKESMAALPFDDETYRQSMGTPALDGEKGYTTLQRRWARPTLDVNGLLSGFTGEGAMTIIPSKAMAKVSMRIVPDQNADTVSAAFDEAVYKLAPKGVEVKVTTMASCGAYVSELDSPGMRAAVAAVEAGYGKKPVFIREGGSLPILPLFKELLGADSIMMGFSVPDCNLHGPNEFFGLSDLHNGIKSAAHFLDQLAKAK